MAIRESELTTITVIGTSDFLRAVTSFGSSRNVTVSNLAKTVVEEYAASSIGGSNQTIKNAIDNPVDSSVLTIYSNLGWVQD